MSDSRYFKCSIVGGFRLADLNLTVKLGQYFPIDSYVVDVSRAVKAAINSKWMVEVDKEEYDVHNSAKIEVKKKIEPQQASISKLGTAIPDVKEVNKLLESRQVIREKENNTEAVATPNINEVEKHIRDRKEESVWKESGGNKIVDNVVKSPAAINKQATRPKVTEIAKAESDDENITTVKALSKDDDDEFEDLKSEITEDLDARIQRRRRQTEQVEITEEN